MANSLQRWWQRFSGIPFGRFAFNQVMGMVIPYTGSMSARVVELRPGFARVTLRDRRKVRNHLKSVHAIALANLGEYTGNLALVCGLPENGRFIVKKLSIEYLKKARGRLTATCEAPVFESAEPRDVELVVEIRDRSDDVVARCMLTSLIGPKK